jgi:hypothetical protein
MKWEDSLTRYLAAGIEKEEAAWLLKTGTTSAHGKCIKRSVQAARKSVKCLSSPAETGPFTAKTATPRK